MEFVLTSFERLRRLLRIGLFNCRQCDFILCRRKASGENGHNREVVSLKVELSNVTKRIGKNTVLAGVNITMESGKIYGFYGRNGSGKTMLFRSIAGLIILTEGTVRIDDKILHKDIRIPKNIGIIIENPGFWNYYTGYENLKALASIKNLIDDTIISNTLKLVGLLEVKDNSVSYTHLRAHETRHD